MDADLMSALARIEEKVDRLLRQTGPRKPSEDGKVFRDPKPKYWDGPSYVGCKLSEAPADYLRAMARYKGACAYACRKENDPAKVQYADRDEAASKLATAWAEYREASGDVAGIVSGSTSGGQADFGGSY